MTSYRCRLTAQVRAALETTAGVRCHKQMERGKVMMDCETTDSCFGERVGHEEPYCGRYSAKNPSVVYYAQDDQEGYYLDTTSSMVSRVSLFDSGLSCVTPPRNVYACVCMYVYMYVYMCVL